MFPEHSVFASCCAKRFSQGTHWILMTKLFKVTMRRFVFSMRHREVKDPAQGHTASKWQSWDFNLSWFQSPGS